MKKIKIKLPTRKLLAGAVVASGMIFSTIASAADVVIGQPNWPSATVTANIMKVIIEDNFGLDVELQSGTNAVIFEAMDKGSMDAHPEVWLPNQSNFTNKYVKQKGTVVQGNNKVPSVNGYCVTKHTAKVTGIKKLSDLADPEIGEKFDTDGDGKGEVWIGVAGWGSTNIEKIRAKSYGFDLTMNLKELDEAVAMAEVDGAVKKDKLKVFYCYSPHHMFAMYDLEILEEEKHDPSKWNIIQPTDDPEWLDKAKAGTSWPEVDLSIHYAKSLNKKHPDVARLFKNMKLSADIIAEMSYGVIVNKKSPNEFAKEWVSKNSSIVAEWLK